MNDNIIQSLYDKLPVKYFEDLLFIIEIVIIIKVHGKKMEDITFLVMHFSIMILYFKNIQWSVMLLTE